MTDEQTPRPPRKRRASGEAPRRRQPREASPQPRRTPPSPQPGGTDEDALAALERLQSLGQGEPAPGHRPAAAPPAERVRARAPRETYGSRSRPRPAAARRDGRTVARIAAPAVFLVAVIVLISLIVQSGVIGGNGSTGVQVSPTPKTTKAKSTNSGSSSTTKTTSGYKTYRVQSGDTLSGIAAKFDTTVNGIEELNPDISGSTLVVGDKIKIPTD